MLNAKRVLRAELGEGEAAPDAAKIEPAINEFEGAVKDFDDDIAGHRKDDVGLGIQTILVNQGKTYLTAAKKLMRRIRDKTPDDRTEQESLSGRVGSPQNVEGSPPQLNFEYNRFVDIFNTVH